MEKILHGLPEKVIFCKRCVMSNQRPSTTPEHSKTDTNIKTAEFDNNGICHACLFSDYKKKIDWENREKQFVELLDQFRSKKDNYDVLVPGSGGKDSIFVSHLLKHKYKMKPLTVTWAPHMYTDIGFKNMQSWIHSGFDNLLFTPNGKIHSELTKIAFEKLCNPFQPFIIGQKLLMIKLAKQFGIKLIMYGENQAEYHNKLSDNQSSLMKPEFYSRQTADKNEIKIAGYSTKELIDEFNFKNSDLENYIPLERSEIEDLDINVHYTSFFVKWIPQEAYYYAVKNANFEPNPHGRSEGTYSKYASLDDKTDGFNYYTMFIKFGQGRATNDAAHEIRDGHLTREEGVSLVKKFDGEFPKLYFKEFLNYINLSEEKFHEVIDKNRSPHLWKKNSFTNKWELLHQVT